LGRMLVVLLALMAAASSRAQSAAAATPPVAFDVISVREVRPEAGVATSWNHTGSGFAATTTVETFVQNAYGFVLADQILDLPGWAQSQWFAISARMEADSYADYQRLPQDEQERAWRAMLQDILADRFHLQGHSETRRLPVYTLVAAAGKPKLQPSPPGPQSWSVGRGRIAGHGMPLSTLCDLLSQVLGRVVVDRTGLRGAYDVSLTWTPDDAQEPSNNAPSLFTALEEQLGLRILSGKAPVPVLVIDHIEKPSAN